MKATVAAVLSSFATPIDAKAHSFLANYAMTQIVNLLEKQILAEKRKEREEASAVPSIDLRNEDDENARGDEYVAAALGFTTRTDSVEDLYALWAACNEVAMTRTTDRYSRPMSIRQYLMFLHDARARVDHARINQICDVLGISRDSLEAEARANKADDQKRFAAIIPDLMSRWGALSSDKDLEDACNDISAAHLVNGLVRTAQKLSKEADRQRKWAVDGSDDAMTTLFLLSEAKKTLKDLTAKIERAHSDELDEAFEQGRRVTSSDEIR